MEFMYFFDNFSQWLAILKFVKSISLWHFIFIFDLLCIYVYLLLNNL